jgi:hypothetical protein
LLTARDGKLLKAISYGENGKNPEAAVAGGLTVLAIVTSIAGLPSAIAIWISSNMAWVHAALMIPLRLITRP